MIAELGAFALALALALSILQTGLSAAGRARRSPVLAGAAQRIKESQKKKIKKTKTKKNSEWE